MYSTRYDTYNDKSRSKMIIVENDESQEKLFIFVDSHSTNSHSSLYLLLYLSSIMNC